MGDGQPFVFRALKRTAAATTRKQGSIQAVIIALALLPVDGLPRDAVAGNGMRVVQRAEPRVTVASTILAEPASQAALAIRVGPPEALPPHSFVRLRGLPPNISLTEGHSIGPGSWAIPLFGLTTLKANIPAGASGRSEIVITLVTVDGMLLAEVRTALVVSAAAMPAPAERKVNSLAAPPAVPVGKPDRSSVPRPPELSADDRAHAEKMMAQGDRYLAQGNIALAREFFRRAADAGLAQAAIRAANTYDPAELSRLQVQGVVPNRAEARKWYERARELGAPEAEERLARPGGS
jgi:hypothetical protein